MSEERRVTAHGRSGAADLHIVRQRRSYYERSCPAMQLTN